MNTGTTRIVIVAALVIVGFVVLVNGFAGSGGEVATPGPTGSASVGPAPTDTQTKSPKPPPEPQAPKKIQFFVLNGTNETGLAGIHAERLLNQGLTPVEDLQGDIAGDAPAKGQNKTIVYFRGGDAAAQNEADARWVADSYFEGAAVRELATEVAGTDVVPEGANVVILLGEDSIPSA